MPPFSISAISTYIWSCVPDAFTDQFKSLINDYGLITELIEPVAIASLIKKLNEKTNEDFFFCLF